MTKIASTAKVAIGVFSAFLSTLGVMGCVIAAVFERDGFGGPRDRAPRTWYFALMALYLLACILIPGAFILWAMRSSRKSASIAFGLAITVSIAFFVWANYL